MSKISTNFESITEEDLSQYSDEWIAVINGKVVVHSSSFKKVYEFVKNKYPNIRSLIGKVPTNTPTVMSID